MRRIGQERRRNTEGEPKGEQAKSLSKIRSIGFKRLIRFCTALVFFRRSRWLGL